MPKQLLLGKATREARECVPSSDQDCAETAGDLTDIERRITALLMDASCIDIQAKFRFGDEIHALRYSPVHGPHGVRLLARRLALDESGLLRIARVAERFSATERERLLSAMKAYGFPLAWSHLEELQRVRNSRRRAELAGIALRDRLTVRQLRERVRVFCGRSPSNGAAATDRNG